MLIDLFHYTAEEVALYIELLLHDLPTDDFLIADRKALADVINYTTSIFRNAAVNIQKNVIPEINR